MLRIVHISDLHLHGGAIDHDYGQGGHSFPVLEALTRYLNSLQYQKLVVTGDLTDKGTLGALQNVHTWLTGELQLQNGKRLGLNLPADKFLVIPGNHDLFDCKNDSDHKFTQKRGNNYYSHFGLNPLPNYSIIKERDISLVLFSLDSGKRGTVANGTVSSKDLEQISNWCDEGRRRGLEAPSGVALTNSEFNAAVKILVLHHHLFRRANHVSTKFMDVHHVRHCLAVLFTNDFTLALSGHKHIDYDDRIRFASALDDRALRRFAGLYLARKLGFSHNITLTDKKGRPLQRVFGWAVQLLYKAADVSPIDLDKDLEGPALKQGLQNFTHQVLKNPLQKAEVKKRQRELVREMREVLRSHDFNYVVSNTATKQRGPSADFVVANSFYTLDFERNGSDVNVNVSKHFYDTDSGSFKQDQKHSNSYRVYEPSVVEAEK